MTARLPILAASALLAGASDADACPVVVALEGDPALVASIRDQLTVRGISSDTSTCPGVRTRAERRGEQYVIAIWRDAAAAVPVERVVNDPGTAATVIESFVRVDVGTPLLASRAVPVESVHREPERVPAPVAPRDRLGLHVFGSLDSSFASDRAGSLGMQVGVCVMLGSVCPAARFRIDAVVLANGAWTDSTFRNSADLLVGIDVPLGVKTWRFMPGIAVGMGGVRTHDYAPASGESSIKRETTGLRGEIHGTLLVPLTATLAMDLSVAGVLLQETKIDEGAMLPLPPDPLVVFRFGVGLRYGRR